MNLGIGMIWNKTNLWFYFEATAEPATWAAKQVEMLCAGKHHKHILQRHWDRLNSVDMFEISVMDAPLGLDLPQVQDMIEPLVKASLDGSYN